MKTLTLKPFALCFAILGIGGIVSAENDLNLPDVSQAAEVKQHIALTDITVKYHRPMVNGRKIWGGLVPYGKVWRAGANENTTIEFSDPVSIEGQPLAKGTYGLHMIPNPDSWTVIFSKTNTGWGSYSYKQDEDALRVNVKPKLLAESKATWSRAVEVATAPQLYSYGRRLQSQKQGAEAMEIFKQVDKRFPEGVYGDLARARIKSAAGDFAGAASDAKKAQAAAPTDAQKQSIQALITRLDAKQDVNK